MTDRQTDRHDKPLDWLCDLEDLIVDIRIYSDSELGINSDYW